jgi:two-component system sensor histidine kinase VicK
MKINEIQNFDIENLEGYLENASVGIHIVDPTGVIVWANQIELDMLGYKEEEYIGHYIQEFHHSDSAIRDIFDKILNHETIKNYEAKLESKDGGIVDVLISSNVYEKDDKIIHTRCFTTNVTELNYEHSRIEELQDKLDKSEQKYKDLIETTETGYVILDLNYTVIDANENYIKTFGFESLQDILGYNLRNCLNQSNTEIFDTSFDKVKDGCAINDIEIELTNNKNDYIAIRMHASLIENGENRLFCLVRNISEKKKAEKKRAETIAQKRREITADLKNLKKCLS